MSPLLQLLLLFSCILSATSLTFRCTTRPTCQGMIGYISPNTTTLSSIKDLFGLQSVYPLLAANSWPTKDTNRSITAGSTVRIPFPCSCSNGTGISDRTPVYSVKEGDGLDDIARTIFREFVTYQEIAAVNKISDVNLIDIGQKLWIPLPCSCDDVDAARVVHYGHVVANESWVSQIAGEFGTTEATLMALNNETLSDPNNLQAGQILDVPIKACNSSTVSSLLVPNGSYAFTANNCVQCSCNSNHLGLKCMRAQGVPITDLAQCPSTQCGNLSLGESVYLTTCVRTTCDYAGYNERRILTVLSNQSTCTTSITVDAGRKVNKKIIIVAVSGAIGLFIACIVFVFLIKRFWKRTNDSNNNVKAFSLRRHPLKNVKAFLQNYGSLAPKQVRYSKLKKMTNSFKDKLGEGGYGGVFKGKLKDGRLVAVKVLNNSKGNGEEFINEVASIGRTSHVNIVTLLGFCFEGSKRALIYEFMSNGSLEKFIYSNKSRGAERVLSCGKLLQIAVGIARGLEYLHRGCSTRILHFDIKPHNILLDDEFCPKISDFGLAKLCPKQESIISMQDTRGTRGYIAPELYCRNDRRGSHKSDVFSYGMMVLEMVGGRRNMDAQVENSSEIYFPDWVYNHIALENSIDLIGIVEEEEKEIARKMVLVGLWCIQRDPTNRPSITRVVEMLEGSVHSLEMPPKPYLSSP